MKNFSRILVAILLIFAVLFNTVSCELFNPGIGNSDDITNGQGNQGDSKNDPYADFGKEYPRISVAEAVEIAYDCNSESEEKYYIVATVSEIKSQKNGEMTVSDDTGSILVYRVGNFSEKDVEVGDVVIICGTLYNYKGHTPEFKNATILDSYTPGDALLPEGDDPYVGVDPDEFYSNYTPAKDYIDACYRSKHYLLSGTLGEQDQEPTISSHQPKQEGKLVRNTSYLFSDDKNTYYVVDAYGNVVMEIYRGGAYIMLEEVAAYVFAFGEPPANQTSSKDLSPSESGWGEYLRLNNSKFSGDVDRYPYEPVLPRISGCGGDLTYFEMDIGTTGTDCDPSYPICDYNNGYYITRGAARIVYTYMDRNGNRIIDLDERYVFYTYNHYNDFQEYLNYYGGWGEMFGNITGGGTLSSKNDYNPTDYVETARASIKIDATVVIYYYIPKEILCV